MRLFFALWPELSSARQWQHDVALSAQMLGGRQMPVANLHMTLAFLGEVPGDRVNALIALGNDLPGDAIHLRFDRIECWKNPGLACLRSAETPAALTRLVGQLNTGLRMAGFSQDAKSFRPHITLARHVTASAPSLPVWPVIEWQVPAMTLMRSRLTPEGSEYAVLHEWPLAPY